MLTPEEGHKMMQDVEEVVERYRQYVAKRRKEEAKVKERK